MIYTPTEGEAIQNFSRLFRRPEGCFLSITNQPRIYHDLGQFGKPDDIDYIVVSDGEEILGIGDQGVGAILISIAKLVLATACAGIHPNRTLPVVLDCGTDNQELLDDDLYMGLRQRRVRGKEYAEFVDKFVQSARKLYPKAYIHFEDFGLANARKILEKYRPEFACFNDDVQGTGCVTLAGLGAALKVANVKIQDAKMVVFGAGTAGTGIADMVCDAIATESGKSKEDAARQIWCVDKPGLLLKSHGDRLTPAQKPYARGEDDWNGGKNDLLAVVKKVKPNILIGCSTCPKSFTEEIIKEMASHIDRPIIFPLSNPTRLHEAKPKDLIEWTKGKALVATGSPFPTVEYGGKKIEIAECNNSTIFPGIGLGTVLCRAARLTDGMLIAATKALASWAPALDKGQSKHQDAVPALLPDVEDVSVLSVSIACAVIRRAIEEKQATVKDIPEKDEDLEEWVKEQMWKPEYRPLRKVTADTASREARGEMGVAGGSS